MSSYNPNNNNQMITNGYENKNLFNRVLRGLSNFGMDYDDMVIRNQVGIGINEDPYASRTSMYDFFSQRAVASVLNKKSIPYLDKMYGDKRRILREYSIKDEIRNFVSKLTDECIIYNEKDFCHPKPLSNRYSEDVSNKYQEYFEKIYNRYGFSDSISAWNMMRDFLIDGYVSMEIVWDDKKKNIIHFNQLPPESLVPGYEPGIGNLWIQYPEDPQLRRIFLDSCIIHISYSTQNDYGEISYLEGLIKPYNQLKIIEQTRIMFNLINASIYQKFVIPVKNLPKHKAEEQIAQLISDYSEEVEWDDALGTVTINGSKHLPYNKQIWFPEGDGTPTMELVSPEGHNLNESDMLTWFYNVLKRASKIPFGRFDKENGGGNIFTDASEMTHDEIEFGTFVNRIRANFKELIVKPLKMQMCVEFPELRDDDLFMNDCDIIFNSNQVFETWKRLNNMSKKADMVNSLLQIMRTEDRPYFHVEYLMDTVFELTKEEKDRNESYWAKDKTFGMGSGEAGGEGEDFGGGEAPEAGGGEETGGGEVPEAGDEAPEAGGGDTGGDFEF